MFGIKIHGDNTNMFLCCDLRNVRRTLTQRSRCLLREGIINTVFFTCRSIWNVQFSFCVNCSLRGGKPYHVLLKSILVKLSSLTGGGEGAKRLWRKSCRRFLWKTTDWWQITQVSDANSLTVNGSNRSSSREDSHWCLCSSVQQTGSGFPLMSNGTLLKSFSFNVLK